MAVCWTLSVLSKALVRACELLGSAVSAAVPLPGESLLYVVLYVASALVSCFNRHQSHTEASMLCGHHTWSTKHQLHMFCTCYCCTQHQRISDVWTSQCRCTQQFDLGGRSRPLPGPSLRLTLAALLSCFRGLHSRQDQRRPAL